MPTLSAQSIRARGSALVRPFVQRGVAHGRTYGVGPCGYDVTLAQSRWVWPLFGRLASIEQYLNLPHDLWAEVKDKSTNARLFTLVQNTVIEPGWRGFLTVELTRDRPWPIYLPRGTPIAQIMFHTLDEPTDSPYEGKYQDQAFGPAEAILESQVPPCRTVRPAMSLLAIALMTALVIAVVVS